MAAADKGKGGGGVYIAAAQTGLRRGAARIRLILGLGLLSGGLGAGADDAVLGLERDLHAFGQVGGDHGRQADAQVHHVAVLQLFGNTFGDKALDLRLFHYAFPPSTMYLM